MAPRVDRSSPIYRQIQEREQAERRRRADADAFDATPTGVPRDCPTPEAAMRMADDALRMYLGREPTAEEMTLWHERVESEAMRGATRAEIAGWLERQIKALPEAQGVAAARDEVQKLLGREDTDGRFTAQARDLSAQGKTEAEIRAAIAFSVQQTDEYQFRHPEEMVNAAYREFLGRDATSAEVEATRGPIAAWQAEGRSAADTANGVRFCVAVGDDAQALRFDQTVEVIYQEELGRSATPEEQANAQQSLERFRAEGKPVPEIANIVRFCVALSPEWQERHRPPIDTNRDNLYLRQPNGWSCGPTSLTMAMAAIGVRPSNTDTMWEMANLLGARAGLGTPGGPDLIAQKARELGVNATSSTSMDPQAVREALERGHGVIVNGGLGPGTGHFIYISGLDENGQYIVCDPWRPEITRWNDDQLRDFEFSGYPGHPPGFAEIWR